MTSQELVERYVNEIGRNLPRKNRADIERELYSLIQDTLEERAYGEEPTIQQTIKVLNEFGSPEEMAKQYRPEEHLIGPNLFPYFRVVVSVMFIVLTVLNGILLVLMLWQGNDVSLGDRMLAWFKNYASNVIWCIGLTTAIFFAIERIAGDEISHPAATEADWDPMSLPPINDPNQINRFSLLTEIVVGVVATVVFLWFLVGSGILDWLFTDSFKQLIGWFAASAAIDILLKAAVFWQGRWTKLTRIFELGAEIFGFYVLYLFFRLPEVTNFGGVNFGFRFVIAICMVIVGFAIVVQVFNLLTKREPTNLNRWWKTAFN